MGNKDLYGSWVHSQEEDRNDEMVFRPESYDFPLRRGGRKMIHLKTDQTFIERDTAPDDRYNQLEGRWEWDGDKENVLSLKSDVKPGIRQLQIVSVNPDKLVVKKYE